MNKYEIKNKAWNDISKFNNLDDGAFNTSAISFKINNNYNLAVWCDIESECGEPFRCYIVSVRFNPHDELFGDDIDAEYSTNDLSKGELEKAIEYVLSHKELKDIFE